MKNWITQPIKRTCQHLCGVRADRFCGQPTKFAYPAMGIGWMALCDYHAAKHPEAERIETLISHGEEFESK